MPDDKRLMELYNAYKSDDATNAKSFGEFKNRMYGQNYRKMIFNDLAKQGAKLSTFANFEMKLGYKSQPEAPKGWGDMDVNNSWQSPALQQVRGKQASDNVNVAKQNPLDETERVTGRKARTPKLAKHNANEFFTRTKLSDDYDLDFGKDPEGRFRKVEYEKDRAAEELSKELMAEQAKEKGKEFGEKYDSAFMHDYYDQVGTDPNEAFGAMMGAMKGADERYGTGAQLQSISDGLESWLTSDAVKKRIESKAALLGVEPYEIFERMTPRLQKDLYEEMVKRNIPKSDAEYVLSGVLNSVAGNLFKQGTMSDESRQVYNEGVGRKAAEIDTRQEEDGFWSGASAAKYGNVGAGMLADAAAFAGAGKMASGTLSGLSKGLQLITKSPIGSKLFGGVVSRSASELTKRYGAEGAARIANFVGSNQTLVGRLMSQAPRAIAQSGLTLGYHSTMMYVSGDEAQEDVKNGDFLGHMLENFGEGGKSGLMFGAVGAFGSVFGRGLGLNGMESSLLERVKHMSQKAAVTTGAFVAESLAFRTEQMAEEWQKDHKIDFVDNFVQGAAENLTMKLSSGHLGHFKPKNILRSLTTSGVDNRLVLTESEKQEFLKSRNAQNLMEACESLNPEMRTEGERTEEKRSHKGYNFRESDESLNDSRSDRKKKRSERLQKAAERGEKLSEEENKPIKRQSGHDADGNAVSTLQEFLDDKSVSLRLRQKVSLALTGVVSNRLPRMSHCNVEQDEKGRYAVKAYSESGELLSVDTYKTEGDAEAKRADLFERRKDQDFKNEVSGAMNNLTTNDRSEAMQRAAEDMGYGDVGEMLVDMSMDEKQEKECEKAIMHHLGLITGEKTKGVLDMMREVGAKYDVDLFKAMDKDYLKRTEEEVAALDELGKRLRGENIDSDDVESRVEVARQDGADKAEEADVRDTESVASDVNEYDKAAEEAGRELQDFMKAHDDLREYLMNYTDASYDEIGEMFGEDVASEFERLSLKYNEAVASRDGYMNRTGQKIDEEVDRQTRREATVFLGKIGGMDTEGKVVRLMDAEGNVYLLLSGEMTLENGELRPDEEGVGFVVRREGSDDRILMLDGSMFVNIDVKGYDEYREMVRTRLQEEMSAAIDEGKGERGDSGTIDSMGGEPAEPTEPQKPAEPTEPQKPAEPTEPQKPAEPTEPQKPTEPEGNGGAEGNGEGGEGTGGEPERRKFKDGTDVPLDENGEPDFTKMSAEQGAELYEEDFGDSAGEVLDTNIKAAQKELKDAEKIKIPAGGYSAQAQAMKERNAAIASAKAKVEAFEDIKKAITERKLSSGLEQGGGEAQATETNPDTAIAKEKFDKAPKLKGRRGTRTLADGTKISGTYYVVPAFCLTPSHDPFNGYRKSEGFPVDKNGKTMNDRDYERDKEAQSTTDGMSRPYNGKGVEYVPIVQDGLPLDGNGRTMARQKAGKQGTDAPYMESLKENIEGFGLKAEDLEKSGIEYPTMIFVPDERLPLDTKTFALFNRNEKKTMSNTEQAVAAGKKLDAKTVASVISEMEGYGSLDGFFGSAKGVSNLMKRLVEKGVIGQNEVAGLMDGELLSASGEEFVENMLLGSLFNEDTVRMMGVEKGLKRKVLQAMRPIMDTVKLGEYSLREEVDQAVALLYEARRNKMSVSDLLKQTDMFREDARKRYPEVSQIMALALEGKAGDLKALLEIYNSECEKRTQNGQNMFESMPTKEEFIQEILTLEEWSKYGIKGKEERGGGKEGPDVGGAKGAEPQTPGRDGEGGGVESDRKKYLEEHPLSEEEIDKSGVSRMKQRLAKKYLRGEDESELAKAAYISVYKKLRGDGEDSVDRGSMGVEPQKPTEPTEPQKPEGPEKPVDGVGSAGGGNDDRGTIEDRGSIGSIEGGATGGKPSGGKPTAGGKAVSDRTSGGTSKIQGIFEKMRARKDKNNGEKKDGLVNEYNVSVLNDDQRELMLDALEAAAELTYGMFEEGDVKSKEEWKDYLRKNLSDLIKEATGYSDKDVEDLYEDFWHAPYYDEKSGKEKDISDWAKDFGIKEDEPKKEDKDGKNGKDGQGGAAGTGGEPIDGGGDKPADGTGELGDGERPGRGSVGGTAGGGAEGGIPGTGRGHGAEDNKTGEDTQPAVEGQGGNGKPVGGMGGQPVQTGVGGALRRGGNGANDGEGTVGGDKGGAAERRSRNMGRDVLARVSQEKVEYESASDPKGEHAIGSVLPSGIADSVKRAFDKLVKQVKKNVTDFVRDELGYSSDDEMFDGLSSEQVDSVALAINAMKNGKSFIIGDQTGVGKGRQVAALIRWGRKNGKKVIFVTERPQLFSDMYRDITDIGSELMPYTVNTDPESNITDGSGKIVYRHPSLAATKALWESGEAELPMDKNGRQYDFLMMTYSQASSLGKENNRSKKEWIEQYAQDAIIIMDESHNASGQSARGGFFSDLASRASGVTFASATFAKRPDNMLLYAQRSSLAEVNMTREALIEAVKQYGVPMQEILSDGLFGTGEMIRRERDMKGVKTTWTKAEELYDKESYEKARKTSDRTMDLVNSLINFQRTYVNPKLREMEAEFNAGGEKTVEVKNAPYSGQVSNIVNLLVYGLKARKAAAMAIEQIKAGKKPVIAVENTLGSYVNGMEGDVADIGFSRVLEKGIDFVLKYKVVKHLDDKDKSESEGNIEEELSYEGQAALASLREEIRKYSVDQSIEQLTMSPIDLIKEELAKAGYKCGEITGRTKQLVRNEDGTYRVEGMKVKKKEAASRFNGGSVENPLPQEEQYDALILNAAGATGISLHASEKFGNQQQRSMIILQPTRDVNTEVQMRGRIDRTGQLHRGEYYYLTSPIPAEQKAIMMLRQKLASLDANASGTENVSSNRVEAEDMDNKYGNEVAKEFLMDHLLDINSRLERGQCLENEHNEWTAPQDLLYGLLKGIQRLDCETQEYVLNELATRYKDKIDYLDQNGINDLKTTTLNLEAETDSEAIFVKGKDNTSDNQFAHDTKIERVTVNVLRKPIRSEEIAKRMKKNGALTAEGEINKDYSHEIEDSVERYIKASVDKLKQKMEDTIASIKAKKRDAYPRGEEESEEAYEERLNKIPPVVEARMRYETQIKQLEADLARQEDSVVKATLYLKPGMACFVPLTDNIENGAAMSYGRFVGFENKTGDPRKVRAVFATRDSRGLVSIPCVNSASVIEFITHNLNDMELTELAMNPETGKLNQWYSREYRAAVDKWWDAKIPKNTNRGERYMITGNILQACGSLGKYKGQIVTFTRRNAKTGEVTIERGMLLAENFDPENFKVKSAVTKEDVWYSDKEIKDDMSKISVSRQGDTLVVTFSKRGSEKLVNHPVFGDAELSKIAMTAEDGTKYSRGKNSVSMTFAEKNVEKALELLYKNHSFAMDKFFVMPESEDKVDKIDRSGKSADEVIKELGGKYGKDEYRAQARINEMKKRYKMDADNAELKAQIREAVMLRQAYIRKRYAGESTARLGWEALIQEGEIDRLSRELSKAKDEKEMLQFRDSLEITRNVREAFLEELEYRGEGKSTELHLKQGKWSADDAKALFDRMNSNKENAELMERVFERVRSLGIKPVLNEKIQSRIGGMAAGSMIEYNWKYMNSQYIPDQAKADTILHEMIHTVTAYADYLVENGMEHLLKPEMVEAVQDLKGILNAINTQDVFIHNHVRQYGLTNVAEMLAEYGSNESFREDMKKANLWTKLMDGIMRFFGFERNGARKIDAYEAVRSRLEELIEGFDEAAWRKTYEGTRYGVRYKKIYPPISNIWKRREARADADRRRRNDGWARGGAALTAAVETTAHEERGTTAPENLMMVEEVEPEVAAELEARTRATQAKRRPIVEAAARKLGVNVEVYDRVEDVEDADVRSAIERGEDVRGWYDMRTGEVHLYTPNITDKYDAQKTVAHEVVGHKGMRGLLGERGYRDMLRRTYTQLSAEEATAVNERMMREGMDFYEAMDEYVADRAEDMVWDAESATLWENVKHYVGDAMREAGYHIQPSVDDVRYWLWASRRALKNGDVNVEIRRKAYLWKLHHQQDKETFENDLALNGIRSGDTEEDRIGVAYRKGSLDNRKDDAPLISSTKAGIEHALDTKSARATECWVDSKHGLKVTQDIMGKGLKHGIDSSMDAYHGAINKGSIVSEKTDNFVRHEFKAMNDAIKRSTRALGGRDGYERLKTYAYVKSGLERNRVLYVRDKAEAMNSVVEKLNKSAAAEAEKNGVAPVLLTIDGVRDYRDAFHSEKKYLDSQLSQGKIGLEEYYGTLDEYIRKFQLPETGDSAIDEQIKKVNKWYSEKAGGKYDGDENDYSGIHSIEDFKELGEASDKNLIDHVMQTEAELGVDNVRDLWNGVRGVTQFALDNDYNYGQIDKQSHYRAGEMFNWYVPMRGFDEGSMEDTYAYMRQEANGVGGSVVKHAEGRKSLGRDIFGTAAYLAERSIARGEDNKNKQRLYRLAQQWIKEHSETDADGDIVMTEEPPMMVSDIWYTKRTDPVTGDEYWEAELPRIDGDADAKSVRSKVERFNAAMKAAGRKGTATRMEQKGRYDRPFEASAHKNENIVFVTIGGQRKMVIMPGNPRAAQAINGELESPARNSKFMRAMAAAFTSYNITFSVTNTMRDTVFANNNVAVRESPEYWRKFTANQGKLLSGLTGYYTMLGKYKRGEHPKGRTQELFWEFMDNGGRTGFVKPREIRDLETEIRTTANRSDIGATVDKLLHYIPEAIEGLNARMENLNRFAAYMTSRQEGRSVMRSVSDAKEVSTNFNRSGSGSKAYEGQNVGRAEKMGGMLHDWAKKNYLFFNAGMQSLALLSTNLKKHPVKTTFMTMAMPMVAGGLLIPALNAMIASMCGEDDDKYCDLPEWDRRNNICIYGGKGRWLKIALPIEIRAFYGLGDVALGMGDERYRSTKGTTLDALSQLTQILPLDFMGEGGDALGASVPDWAKPIYHIVTNKDWTGKPLYKDSEWNKYEPEWQKSFAGEDSWFVGASRGVNEATGGTDHTKGWADGVWNNPAVWSELVNGYAGGAGGDLMRGGRLLNRVATWNWEDFSAREVPVLRAGLSTPTERSRHFRTLNKYYKYKDEAEHYEHDFKSWSKDEDPTVRMRAIRDAKEQTKDYQRAVRVKALESEIKKVRRAMDKAKVDDNVRKDVERRIEEAKVELVKEFEKND